MKNTLFSTISLVVLLHLLATVNFAAAPTADELLKKQGFVWKTAVTEHLRLHYEPGTVAEAKIEGLKRLQEHAFNRNLQVLDINEYASQTDIFIVNSRPRMKELIGRETNGYAWANTKVVCFIVSQTIIAAGAHELMHVMSRNTWTGKPATWIVEGLAVYADDAWYRYELHQLCKHLLTEKKLVPIEKLLDGFKGSHDMITYPQSGSFVKYLYETYGVEKVKELWVRGYAEDFRLVLGKDVQTVEKEWHQKLMEADASGVRYDFE